MMDRIASLLFLSSMTESIQRQCKEFLKGESWVTVTGQLNLTFSTGEIVGYVLDEKVSTNLQQEFNFLSFSSPLMTTDVDDVKVQKLEANAFDKNNKGQSTAILPTDHDEEAKLEYATSHSNFMYDEFTQQDSSVEDNAFNLDAPSNQEATWPSVNFGKI